jgi:hypothetical protein
VSCASPSGSLPATRRSSEILLANIGALPCPVIADDRTGCSDQENEIAIIVREELNDIYAEAPPPAAGRSSTGRT